MFWIFPRTKVSRGRCHSRKEPSFSAASPVDSCSIAIKLGIGQAWPIVSRPCTGGSMRMIGGPTGEKGQSWCFVPRNSLSETLSAANRRRPMGNGRHCCVWCHRLQPAGFAQLIHSMRSGSRPKGVARSGLNRSRLRCRECAPPRGLETGLVLGRLMPLHKKGLRSRHAVSCFVFLGVYPRLAYI